jgi:hypothetical protein
MRSLDDAPEAQSAAIEKAVVAFIHIEPQDVEGGNDQETKLVKNAKWLARKWITRKIVLHSFSHLGEEKAIPDAAHALLRCAQGRLENADYEVAQTPYGYFNDLVIRTPGHPLARVYKEF